jgi:ribosomal protein L6P/L9E
MIKKITLALLAITSGISGLLAQSNPTAQNLPYTQSFGTASFSSMPAGMAAWLSGGNKATQAAAESSTPAGDASLATATASTATGGVFGYAVSGNARPYIQLSSNATSGTTQLGLAFNTGTATAVNISYQVELLNTGGASLDFGLELMYHSGSTATAAWTAVPGASLVISGTSFSTQTYTYALTGLSASTNYQLRWVTWRAGSGNGKGVGIDNISVSAPAAAVASFNVTNNGLQPTATSVLQGSNKNMLQRFILRETNVAAGTLNTVSIPLAGTYTASDINAAGLKLYTAATNNFASATVLLGKASVAAGSGETVTFNSLNYAVAQNSTQYFWVTSDIDVAATVGNTIRATALNAGNFTFAAGTVTATVGQGGIQTIAPLVPSLNITNNGTQPAAGTVFQSSNNNLLQSFVVTEGNVAAGTLNNVSIPFAGTYVAADINTSGLKLYGGTTNSFASATLLSSKASTSLGSGETVNFNALNYAIAKNSTQYFWVTADIDASANVGNDIHAASLSAGNFTFAAGTVTATVSAGGAQTILEPDPVLNIADNGTQPAAASVIQNSNDNLLQSFVIVEGNVGSASLTGIAIPLAGTYLASDINGAGLKLYGSTANNFASATLLSSQASASAGSGETATFALTLAIAKNSTYYFWVTADISGSATVGNTINAASLNAGNFTFAAGTVTASVNAGGIQTIDPAPVTTQLRTTYCGYTAQSFGEFIGADSVLTANHYRFQLVNTATSYTQTFTNSSGYPYLTLYTIPGISYNTTYTVTVAWSADGISWSPYGSPCSITSPVAEITQLEPGNCGYTASSYTEVIRADLVSGATQYEFKLENAGLGYSQSLVKTNNNFNLSQFTGLLNASTYSVSVRVFIFGAWDIYGPECQLTTPAGVPTTSLQPTSCGVTVSSYPQILFAEPVGAAMQYEYKLENTALGYSQTFVKTNNNFNLAQFTGLLNSTTYSVSVRVNINNSWGSFGTECQVTTPSSIPSTSLQPSYCGIVATAYDQIIFATNVTGATQYEYKLENAGSGYSQTYVKSNSNFNLTQFTGLVNNTTYSVSVRVYIGGSWGSFGPACTVTTPATTPTTSLQPSSCGITLSGYTQILFAVAVTGATQYEYKLENAGLGYSQSFAKSNNNFNFGQFSGLLNNTPYDVQVRVFFNGVWGNYGAMCTVTSPSSARMASAGGIENADSELEEKNGFDAMAYPNPFNSEFSLNLVSYMVSEPINIRVYDATGKLVEEHILSPESAKDLKIGTAYAEGLYNILMSQGTQTKSIKVIRQ